MEYNKSNRTRSVCINTSFFYNDEIQLHIYYIHVSISSTINRPVEKINFNNFRTEKMRESKKLRVGERIGERMGN